MEESWHSFKLAFTFWHYQQLFGQITYCCSCFFWYRSNQEIACFLSDFPIFFRKNWRVSQWLCWMIQSLHYSPAIIIFGKSYILFVYNCVKCHRKTWTGLFRWKIDPKIKCLSKYRGKNKVVKTHKPVIIAVSFLCSGIPL